MRFISELAPEKKEKATDLIIGVHRQLCLNLFRGFVALTRNELSETPFSSRSVSSFEPVSLPKETIVRPIYPEELLFISLPFYLDKAGFIFPDKIEQAAALATLDCFRKVFWDSIHATLDLLEIPNEHVGFRSSPDESIVLIVSNSFSSSSSSPEDDLSSYIRCVSFNL